MPIGLFGIENGGLDLAVNLIVLFLVVLWLALIAWTYLDAKRRIEDNVLVICATLASLFPFVGTLVYTILRPPEFLDDAKERDLEVRAAELRVRQLTEQSCPNCEYPIERSYLRCPNCRARLKDPCPSCSKPLDPRWSVCPYCEMPVRQVRKRRAGAPRSREETRAREEARPRPERAEQPKRRRVVRAKRAEAEEAQEPASRRTRVTRRAKSQDEAEAPQSKAPPEPQPTEESPTAEKRSRSSESRPAPTP
jgi:Double zinc ribbon